MKKVAVALGMALLLTGSVRAQPAFELKTETRTESPLTSTPVTNPRSQYQYPVPSNRPTNTPWTNLQDLQKQIEDKFGALESQIQGAGPDTRVNHWLNGWWLTGFYGGILWIPLWVFVGWQWRRRRFWGFGWPWPWWFWLPWLWFIPWLVIAWQWWLAWWPWWAWLWWVFPWIFWLFWWLIVFKEVLVWLGKK